MQEIIHKFHIAAKFFSISFAGPANALLNIIIRKF